FACFLFMIMKQRIFYIIRLYFLFLAFFLFSKILFLVYHIGLTREAGFPDALKIFYHGLRLDLSASAYLMLIPFLLLIVSSIIRKDIFKAVIPWYNGVIVIVLSLIIVADLELYKYWGFRLDVTPLLYIKTPKEAMASVSVWVVIRQLILAAVLSISFLWILNRRKVEKQKYEIIEIPLYLLLLAFMIVPIRGGFGIAPLNVGSAYFSQNNYLNHAAINVFWNLGNSLADQDNKSHKYDFFKEEQADSIVKPYLNQNDTTGAKIITSSKPNIILIMLESFTANVIEPLGGLKGVTPNLNALSNEGVFFRNFYASGDRSDKGLIAILSGYPAQTTFSVIKDAAKTQSMPKLPSDLKQLGYNTSFYYGGDLNFANMRSFLISARFDKLISMEDFPSSSYNSKWGAHDEVVFKRLFDDLNKAKAPFFKMIFTLSSHESFEVPSHRAVKDDISSKFVNSISYTDSCLGSFIHNAKKQAWWQNTWVIIVADHGVRYVGNLKGHVPEKFRIPMLWLGGAVNKQIHVDKAASQVDIPATVLTQLGVDAGKYMFSRNIFGEKQKTDAFYIYNNGVGMVNDTMKLVFDCSKKAILQKKGNISDSLVNASKAYIQTIYKDLNNRK
ncbi:MAG TPA: sulfatase-like hydrolase/transferase, partial [Bacteroidales bacterium]|nr:sulfatase-like hydrolase/transferase [Bacteroidales bacterium]